MYWVVIFEKEKSRSHLKNTVLRLVLPYAVFLKITPAVSTSDGYGSGLGSSSYSVYLFFYFNKGNRCLQLPLLELAPLLSVLVDNEVEEAFRWIPAECIDYWFSFHHYPDTKMICGDITNEDIRNGLIEEAKKFGVNFVMATPPCQGMSIAGNMDPLDERNQLIYYAVDVIKKLKPDFALIENVPRTLVTKIKYDDDLMLIPEYLHRELGSDYKFNCDTLIKAMDYGVPQMRERNIFLLTKKKYNFTWCFPKKETHQITLKEAIGDLPSLDPYVKEGYTETLALFPDFEKKKAAAAKISKWHYPPIHNKRQIEWMMHTPSGESATTNEVWYPQKPNGDRISAHYNHYRRHNWDKPSRTITQNNGVISSLCCVHPGHPYTNSDGETLYSDPRVFTIYELLIVSSLPTDWNIPKWAKESLIRHVIGEGIPPLMVRAVMCELLKNLKELKL